LRNIDRRQATQSFSRPLLVRPKIVAAEEKTRTRLYHEKRGKRMQAEEERRKKMARSPNVSLSQVELKNGKAVEKMC
jgi:hypothetical protein